MHYWLLKLQYVDLNALYEVAWTRLDGNEFHKKLDLMKKECLRAFILDCLQVSAKLCERVLVTGRKEK